MRFVYILIGTDIISQMQVTKGDDDNLATYNEGPELPDAYFTCGDLVFSYSTHNGEILSLSGYLPYFDTLPVVNISFPELETGARVFVGDLTQGKVFNVEKLKLEVSKDKSVLHAGSGKSKRLTHMSPYVAIGFTDERITDLYLRLL